MLVCTFTEFAKVFFEGFGLGLIVFPVSMFIWLWISGMRK